MRATISLCGLVTCCLSDKALISPPHRFLVSFFFMSHLFRALPFVLNGDFKRQQAKNSLLCYKNPFHTFVSGHFLISSENQATVSFLRW